MYIKDACMRVSQQLTGLASLSSSSIDMPPYVLAAGGGRGVRAAAPVGGAVDYAVGVGGDRING
jgi:hypothetical protein